MTDSVNDIMIAIRRNLSLSPIKKIYQANLKHTAIMRSRRWRFLDRAKPSGRDEAGRRENEPKRNGLWKFNKTLSIEKEKKE